VQNPGGGAAEGDSNTCWGYCTSEDLSSLNNCATNTKNQKNFNLIIFIKIQMVMRESCFFQDGFSAKIYFSPFKIKKL
jgi:hypothetical protein